MKAIDLYHKFTALLALCLLALIPATASAQRQRTVYCMGEMVIDILFRGQEPVGAYAGGSALNSAVSLGRAGVNVEFMGEVGNDSTGMHIVDFLTANHVGTSLVRQREGMKTTVSLAYLNEHNDARYIFFMDEPKGETDLALPDFHKDDILLLGSFYAVAPRNRKHVEQVLQRARERGAIVYYDVNLRSPHAAMLPRLMPALLSNMKHADVVRASRGDLRTTMGTADADSAYRTVVGPRCPLFVCTRGADAVTIFTGTGTTSYPVEKIKTVSTIGAGDNFNAGFIYGLVRQGITRAQLACGLDKAVWQRLEDTAQLFSQDCCKHLSNYISPGLAAKLRAQE